MSGDGDLRGTWDRFYRAKSQTDIRRLVDEYPQERSLYVDVLELYGFDETFTQELFGNPDRFLEAGAEALSDLHEPFDRVNVRLTNHPGLLGLGAVRSRHAFELVTVEATVTEVHAVQSAVSEAVYACEQCGSLVRRRPGPRLRPPHQCGDCGADGPFDLRHDRSTFVDVQWIELEALADESGGNSPAQLDAIVDDDLVGTAGSGDQLLATGVVRLDGDEAANRFDFYLDVNSLSQEPRESRPPVEDISNELQEAIQSRWELLANW